MTRNDVLNDERIKRYSEGKATAEDLGELRELAKSEPLYAEALLLFAPFTEGEQSRILEHARLQVQLAELKDAVRVVMRERFDCVLCDKLATHVSESDYLYCDEHTVERRAKGRDIEPLSFAEPVRRLQALLGQTTCEQCGSSARIALHGGRWLCVKCHPSLPCPKCGVLCKPVGVERFGVVKAGNNAEYDLDQEMGFRCMGNHDWQVREKTTGMVGRGSLFFGPVHKGPAYKP